MLILTESCKDISEYFIKTSSAVSLSSASLATRNQQHDHDGVYSGPLSIT